MSKVVGLDGKAPPEAKPNLAIADVLRFAMARNDTGEYETLVLAMVHKDGTVTTGWHYEDDAGAHIPIGAAAILQHQLLNDPCES